jgi:hypothetical protein
LGYYPGTMRDNVQAAVSHQVIGPTGLHRRMDRSIDARAPRLVEFTDNLHRRLRARFRSRSRSGPCIITGGQECATSCVCDLRTSRTTKLNMRPFNMACIWRRPLAPLTSRSTAI